MPTTLTNGIQLPDKGSVDWYSSMQSNYNLIDTHLGDTDTHVTAEDKANWNSKQGSLSQAQLDAIAQVATNTSDIATLQSGKADASHTHSSSDITDIDDYATKDYVDNSISGLVDNAPAALDTLKELSTALNDDANFASTVTTALAAKADSADLATVATSGSYNDLSNKPTINDSTITIQKNGSTVDTFTTNGSNKTINISVPTKTSDLTNDSDFVVSSNLATVATSGFYNDLDNKPYIPDKISDLIDDSNFVDTSNPAVASGITSAKVTSYDTHIADTDIHVTTADKTKWNNGVTQSYVFRYSSTALVASSTNSNTLLDNTDNLKVGDKVIDSSGVLFSITAIDTQNSTFTIGTALVDLAQDSDVVHKSGNETIGGNKTFTGTNEILRPSGDHKLKITDTRVTPLNPTESITSNITWQDSTGRLLGTVANVYDTSGNSIMQLYTRSFNANGEQESHRLRIISNKGGNSYADVDVNFLPSYDNRISLGSSTLRWNGVYATNYYYGSNNVEFSNKFVTTDTAQIISGAKTFSDALTIYNSDSSQNTKNLTISSSKIQVGDTSNNDAFGIRLNAGASYVAQILAVKDTSGTQNLQLDVRTKDNSNNLISSMARLRLYTNGYCTFEPNVNTSISLGSPSNKWNKINGVEPSSLSLPVAPSSTSYVDISSYITVLDSSSANTYTPPSNGYITFSVTGNLVQIFHDYGLQGKWSVQSGNANRGFIPVLGGVEVKIYVIASSVDKFWFIPCQGNV